MLRGIPSLLFIGMAVAACASEAPSSGVTTTQNPLSAGTAAARENAPPRPPPEAFAACQDLAEGAGCSVTFHGRSIDGTCRKGPDANSALACAPAMPPPHGPPQEALDACKSLSEGAACRVTFHDRTMDGTCRKGPDANSALACAPAMPPPR
jgi:hypothetical protein